MNFESMQFGFETVRWLVVTAIGIYAWFIGRQSASAKEMLDLRTRIIKMESEIQQIPKHHEFHELALKFERMDVSVRAVNQHLSELGRSVRRIEDYLMEEAKGQARRGNP